MDITGKPLWRLEIEREQAQRRFKRQEQMYREAERELHRINALIDQRRRESECVHGPI
jgi:hypothetical protein